MIVRFGPPSKMDIAPLGTLCKVSNSSNMVEIYKQISNDEDNPSWILIEEIDLKNQNSEVSNETLHIASKSLLQHKDS